MFIFIKCGGQKGRPNVHKMRNELFCGGGVRAKNKHSKIIFSNKNYSSQILETLALLSSHEKCGKSLNVRSLEKSLTQKSGIFCWNFLKGHRCYESYAHMRISGDSPASPPPLTSLPKILPNLPHLLIRAGL